MAKTPAQRKQDERKRHKESGRVSVTAYVPREHVGKVRELEKQLRVLDLQDTASQTTAQIMEYLCKRNMTKCFWEDWRKQQRDSGRVPVIVHVPREHVSKIIELETTFMAGDDK